MNDRNTIPTDKPPTELGNVQIISMKDAGLFVHKADEGGQTSWLYYFPFLYAFGRQRRRKLFWEMYKGSICLYYIRYIDDDYLVSLYLPPFPFSQEALEYALNKVTSSNPDPKIAIMWVEEKDKDAIERAGLSLVLKESEYIFGNETYQTMEGAKFKRLRQNLNRARKIENLLIRPYIPAEDGEKALELLDSWYDDLTKKGGKPGGYHLLKTTIERFADFPAEIIQGWVFIVDEHLAGCFFCGPISGSMISNFTFVGSHLYPSLGYLQHMVIFDAYPLGTYFNDSSDAGRDGIRHVKANLVPLRLNQLYRAVLRKGKKTDSLKSNAAEQKNNRLTWPAPDGDPMWVDNPPRLWTVAEISSAMQGKWLEKPPENLAITGVCYRYNEIRPGDLFFVRNSKHWRDGDDSRKDTALFFKKGAAAVVTSGDASPQHRHLVFQVENTRRALIELGIRARSRFTGKVIGITGSSGKTSTKEMTRFMLAHQAPTLSTRHNLNHTQGIALSLAQSHPDASFGVYEFGIGDPAYTGVRSELLRPEIAVITEIYPDHLEHYATIEAYADEKCRIFDTLTTDGRAILNRDSEYFSRLLSNCRAKGLKHIMTYGEHPESNMRLLSCSLGSLGSAIRINYHDETVDLTLPVAGRHMVQNALAALSIVAAAGMDWKTAANDLQRFKGVEQRIFRTDVQLNDTQSYILIDDTYNANVASVKAALEQLSLTEVKEGAKKIAVLGGMLYLGEYDKALHESLAEAIGQADIDLLFLCDPSMKHLFDKLPPSSTIRYSESLSDLRTPIIDAICDGDALLIKCSAGWWDDVITPFVKELRQLKKEKTHPPHHAYHKECTITFLGDFSFGENYQENYAADGSRNILISKGYDHPLEKLKPLLLQSNAVLANLETPLTKLRTILNDKKWRHYSDPDKTTYYLKKYNINHVNLANNHIFDFGLDGFHDTIEALELAGIATTGWGRNVEAACKPWLYDCTFENRKVSLAVIAGFEHRQKYEKEYQVYATDNQGGISPIDTTRMKATIERLKDTHPGIFVIVSPHWGPNYRWSTPKQQSLAHAIIDAGADAVIGHGAHMLQEIEHYSGKWILYSIGNSMFNSRGRYDKLDAPPYSLVAQLTVQDPKYTLDISLKLYPLMTNNRKNGYQSYIVNNLEECQKVTDLLMHHSQQLNQALEIERDEFGCFFRLRCR